MHGLFILIWVFCIRNKVDRVLANHSLSSTASQGTSNIPLSSHPSSNLTARHDFYLSFYFVQSFNVKREANEIKDKESMGG